MKAGKYLILGLMMLLSCNEDKFTSRKGTTRYDTVRMNDSTQVLPDVVLPEDNTKVKDTARQIK